MAPGSTQRVGLRGIPPADKPRLPALPALSSAAPSTGLPPRVTGGVAHVAVRDSVQMGVIVEEGRRLGDQHHVSGLTAYQTIDPRVRAGALEAEAAALAATSESPRELVLDRGLEIREAADVNTPPPAFALAPGVSWREASVKLGPPPIRSGTQDYVIEQRGLRGVNNNGRR